MNLIMGQKDLKEWVIEHMLPCFLVKVCTMTQSMDGKDILKMAQHSSLLRVITHENSSVS